MAIVPERRHTMAEEITGNSEEWQRWPGRSETTAEERAELEDDAGHRDVEEVPDAFVEDEEGEVIEEAEPLQRGMDAEDVFYVMDEEALLDADALVDAGTTLDVDAPMDVDLETETGDPDGGIHRQQRWQSSQDRRMHG
jgi:hypothetical protein